MRGFCTVWLAGGLLISVAGACSTARAEEPATVLADLAPLRLASGTEPPASAVDGPIESPLIPHLTDRYNQWRTEVQVMTGFYSSLKDVGPHIKTSFDLLPEDVRLGVMLCDPWPDGYWCRGNLEALVELTTMPVTHGYGSIVVGPSVLLRNNWVQPDARLVPYIQGGAGMVYDDGYLVQDQRVLGRNVEFYLTAAVGLHCQLDPSWSLDVEGGYLHVSNADLAGRNLGINAFGASIGLTYSFGGPCR